MKYILIFALSFHLCTATNAGIYTTSGIANDVFNLEWQVNEHSNSITITLDVNTVGWVGLGISSSGSMTNSDMIICYTANNVGQCDDRWATGFTLPLLDTAQTGTADLTDVNSVTANGRTKYTFTRLLSTGDVRDKQIIQGQSYTILFAIGTLTNQSTINVHTSTFGKELILWPNANGSTQDDSYKNATGVMEMKLSFENYQIPTDYTTYAMKMYNVTQMAAKQTKNEEGKMYHAIAFEAHLAVEAQGYVHHILLYGCSSKVVWQDGFFFQQPEVCYSLSFISGSGDNIMIYPEVAGIVWGGSESQVFMVQIHYNNEQQVSGILDSSYVSVFYTPILRKYDIGISFMGVFMSQIQIPANHASHIVEDTCDSSCSKQMQGPITVIGSFLHGHRILSKIHTKITYANGTVDDTSMRNDDFDNDHQVELQYNPYIVLERGYQLETFCQYNNSGNNQSVPGGPATYQEMCFNFMIFYPRENGFVQCGPSFAPAPVCMLNPPIARVVASANDTNLADDELYSILIIGCLVKLISIVCIL